MANIGAKGIAGILAGGGLSAVALSKWLGQKELPVEAPPGDAVERFGRSLGEGAMGKAKAEGVTDKAMAKAQESFARSSKNDLGPAVERGIERAVPAAAQSLKPTDLDRLGFFGTVGSAAGGAGMGWGLGHLFGTLAWPDSPVMSAERKQRNDRARHLVSLLGTVAGTIGAPYAAAKYMTPSQPASVK